MITVGVVPEEGVNVTPGMFVDSEKSVAAPPGSITANTVVCGVELHQFEVMSSEA